MKRILALLLAMTMALALMACGNKTATPPTGDQNAAAADGQKKTLRVAMECAYAPYNWAQPTDANGAVPISGSQEFANGYDVMMAKLLGEKLGYDIEIVRMDWASIVPAVQSGAVDVGICGQSTTPERREKVDFTLPYYYATIAVLTMNDGKFASATSVADLAGASVTSQKETIWNDICVPQIANPKVLEGQKDAPSMLVALTSGRVEAVVTDQPTGKSAMVAYPNVKMLEFEGDNQFKVSEDDINIGISLKKGNTTLCDELNSVLKDMTEADFRAMMDEAIKVQPLQ